MGIKHKLVMGSGLVLGLIAAQVQAAGTAVYGSDTSDGKHVSTQIEWSAPGEVRAEVIGQPNGYFLAKGGKPYAVANVGGSLMAVDLLQMAQQANMKAPEGPSQSIAQFVSLTDTGRSETIAGITGSVNTLVYVDKGGVQHSEEVVLARDARLVELDRALYSIAESMSSLAQIPAGATKMRDQVGAQGKGTLRFGKQYKLESLNGNVDMARLALPEQTQAAGGKSGMGGLFGGLAGSALKSGVLGNKVPVNVQAAVGDAVVNSTAPEGGAAPCVQPEKKKKGFGSMFGSIAGAALKSGMVPGVNGQVANAAGNVAEAQANGDAGCQPQQ